MNQEDIDRHADEYFSSNRDIFENYDSLMRSIVLTSFKDLTKTKYQKFQEEAKSFLPKRGFLPNGTEF
jgi:hypothetical protein|tara:strand:+ start:22742 stop:22945 length:204 start_codon:yes stop_codon:yes gene_type:complete